MVESHHRTDDGLRLPPVGDSKGLPLGNFVEVFGEVLFEVTDANVHVDTLANTCVHIFGARSACRPEGVSHPVPHYKAPSSSGHTVAWTTWSGEPASRVDLRWENEGWTAQVDLIADRATAVIRLSASWMVQQMLLFRDMDEPDLWLATDGHGRWGEMNGAHRTELDGCVDIAFARTPFTNSIITHRMPLHVGHTADLHVVSIDVESLMVQSVPARYTRHDVDVWEYTSLAAGRQSTAIVDEYGLVIDEEGIFRRDVM